MKKYLLLALCSLILPSCGFQLRQNVSLPHSLQPVHIKASNARQIPTLLKQQLGEQGVAMTEDADKARLWIELSEEQQGERTISVSALSTTLKEVELTQQIYLQLRKPDGSVLLEKKPLRLVREFIYDEQAVLAQASEQQVLRNDMQQEILAHILRRLSRVQDLQGNSQ